MRGKESLLSGPRVKQPTKELRRPCGWQIIRGFRQCLNFAFVLWCTRCLFIGWGFQAALRTVCLVKEAMIISVWGLTSCATTTVQLTKVLLVSAQCPTSPSPSLSGSGIHPVDRMDRGEHSRQKWASQVKIPLSQLIVLPLPCMSFPTLATYTELGSHFCLYPGTSCAKPKVRSQRTNSFSFALLWNRTAREVQFWLKGTSLQFWCLYNLWCVWTTTTTSQVITTTSQVTRRAIWSHRGEIITNEETGRASIQ